MIGPSIAHGTLRTSGASLAARSHRRGGRHGLAVLVAAAVAMAAAATATTGLPARAADDGLRPWPENPWYWSRGGEPVLLLGGSDDDNLFQWPAEQLIPQLDRIAAAGGNVVRNTMSDRKDRGFEVYPFLQLADGRYDLDQWNPEYWDRFERFLTETAARGIIVQIEIWDRFDYTDTGNADRWQAHPYNPANNVTYSYEASGFDTRYPDHPAANRQPFFFTTPAQRNNTVVLPYQERFVSRLLESTLRHDHVLYCIDNETSAEEAWGRFWAEFVRKHAAASGKTVQVTEMWDDWNLEGPQHRRTFDHPELYTFVDVSQNNHNSGRTHWERFLFVRRLLSEHPRPINTTKTYGASGNKFGHTDQDGLERFWRHLLAGAASMRFHRPDSGLGINDKAVAAIRAARHLEALVPLWSVDADDGLLHVVDGDRMTEQHVTGQVVADNSAYAAARRGAAYVLFLPAAAAETPTRVALDLRDLAGAARLQWIDIDRGEPGPSQPLTGGDWWILEAPGRGNFAAVVLAGE